MKRLNRMYLKMRMDRNVDPDKHYISPGGYECCDKHFDFNLSEGGRVTDHPDQVEFYLRDFDDTLGWEGHNEDEPVVITPEDVDVGFAEFYIYTGEPGEPEIAPKELLELSFEFYDDETGEYFEKDADERVINGINEMFSGKDYSYYYVSYIERRDDDGSPLEYDAVVGVAHFDKYIDNPEAIYEVYDNEQGTESGVMYFKTFAEAQDAAKGPYAKEEFELDTDGWTEYISKALSLGPYDADQLLHDLNNLRGDEWIEDLENAIPAQALQAFKDFVGYQEEDLER